MGRPKADVDADAAVAVAKPSYQQPSFCNLWPAYRSSGTSYRPLFQEKQEELVSLLATFAVALPFLFLRLPF